MEEFQNLKAEDLLEPEIQPVTKEDILDKLRLKHKILQYQEKFADELKVYDYKMKDLDQLSILDLQNFLEEIRIAVRQRNSTSMVKSFYFTGINFIEKTSTKLGYDLTGFHNVLFQEKEIHKCLDEISLEFEDSLYMPAYLRLPYVTLQVAMSVGQMRRTENVLNNEMKKKIDVEIEEAYSDL